MWKVHQFSHQWMSANSSMVFYKACAVTMSVNTRDIGPIRRFYEDQNELIGLMGSSPADDEDSVDSKDHPHHTLTTLAINLSYAANILLLLLKIWALIISGSMAMLAAVLDSCLGKNRLV
jgi:hypothetical protein